MLLKIVHDNSTTGVSSELLANARFISQTVKLGTQTTPTCRQFSIEELKEATKNFDLSTDIGEGSIGKLYKGKLENGSYVVIRSLPLSKKCSIQNLKARLDLLSKFQHPNLVTLLGHCIDGGGQDDSSPRKLHLVYEYVPNGNYRTHLSGIFGIKEYQDRRLNHYENKKSKKSKCANFSHIMAQVAPSFRSFVKWLKLCQFLVAPSLKLPA